ncbi:hypothetical protein ABK040_009930 [Willaertia magna]
MANDNYNFYSINNNNFVRSKTISNNEVHLNFITLYINYKEEMNQLAKTKPNRWSIQSISSNNNPINPIAITSTLFTSQLEQQLSSTSTSSNLITTVNNSNENTNTNNNNLFIPIRRFSHLCNDSSSPIVEELMPLSNEMATTRKKTKLSNSTNLISPNTNSNDNNTTLLLKKEGLNSNNGTVNFNRNTKVNHNNIVTSTSNVTSPTTNSLVMVNSTPLEIKKEIDQKEAKEKSGLKRKRGRPKKNTLN